jgi:hypothetical protein
LPFPDYYSGCRVYEFHDQEKAELVRNDGVVKEIASIDGARGTFHGACTFHETSSRTGVIYSQLYIDEFEPFTLYKSHVTEF